MKNLWLIKNKKGRIFGPYSETEIIGHIESGRFKGEEQYCTYPLGHWKLLSKNTLFYESLLKKINAENTEFTRSPDFFEDILPEEKETKEEEITAIISTKKEVKDTAPKKKQVKVKIADLNEEDEQDDYEEDSEIIEMEDTQQNLFNKLVQALILPLIAVAALSAMAFLFLGQDKNKNLKEDKVHLLDIGKQKPPVALEIMNKKFQKSVQNYIKDQVSDYVKSQIQFIDLLEMNPEDIRSYYHLCLVQLELWPFSYQDTRDRRALSNILNHINRLDKGGIYSGLCSSIKALIDNKNQNALMVIDSSLNGLQKENPLFFYYLKAKALKALGRHAEARNYIQTIHNLLDRWVAPYMMNAQMYYEDKNYPQAIKIYQKVLSISPKHVSAGLRLGIIEFNYLKKLKPSEKRIKFILTNFSDEIINPQILLESYQALTYIYLQQQDKKEALFYAQKAYSLNPSDDRLATLITRLGSKESLDKTPIKSRQLIYQGDVLAGKGNCEEAGQYYKQAYSAGKKKNALAAVRMAKCLWQLKISGQSIRWLKKAVAADPKLVEAYFLLVKYLSDSYDFESAGEVLKAAYRQNPSSYEIFKAHALLSFKQKQYSQAIAYAKRSNEVYSSDAEVYGILSKSYRALKDYNKAYLFAKKSIKEDVNNVSMQIGYAFTVGEIYGFSRGEERLQKLSKSFPLVGEYSQALGEYYFEHEKYQEALNTFQQVIKDHPDLKSAYIYLGRTYGLLANRDQDSKKHRLAVKHFIRASLLDISDPEPLFRMGLLYMTIKGGQYLDLAETQFEKVLGLNSNYPLIHYYIGRVNFLQSGPENLDRALQAAKTESQKNPNLSLAYVLTGDIYKKKAQLPSEAQDKQESDRNILGYYELCTKAYQKAIRLNDKQVKFYVELMTCYKGSGDLESAIQIGEQARESEGTSGYPEIYRQLGYIYEIRGNYQKAQEVYEDYFKLVPGVTDRKKIEKRIQGYGLKK